MFKKILTSALIVSAVAGAAIVSSPATYASSQTCVDGNVKSNLVASMPAHNTVTITTKNNAPLCNDTTLYFSSYVMPTNYNGAAFENNPTASPQTKFATTVITLKKGMNSTTTATVSLPNACNNIQTDVYYGPEITTVTAAGHGVKWIIGELNGVNPLKRISMAKTTPACEVPTTPTTPVTPTTPTTPSTPVTPVTPSTSLPSTGISDFTPLIAVTLAGAAYGATRMISRRLSA